MPHIDSSRGRLSSLKAKAISPEPQLLDRGGIIFDDDKGFLPNKTSSAMRTPSPLDTSFQRSFLHGKKQSTDSNNTSLRKRSIGGGGAGGGSKFMTPQTTSFSRMNESMSFRREQRG